MRKTLVVAVLIAVAAVAIFFVSSKAQAQTPNQSYGVCYAYTYCPNSGRTISCRVQGNSNMGVACNWWVEPGVSVSCNGYVWSNFGWMWETFFVSC